MTLVIKILAAIIIFLLIVYWGYRKFHKSKESHRRRMKFFAQYKRPAVKEELKNKTYEEYIHYEKFGKMEPQIIRNVVRCLSCNDIIESKTRHDFKTCSCGLVSVDGGRDYLKRSFPSGNASDWLEELSEWKDT